MKWMPLFGSIAFAVRRWREAWSTSDIRQVPASLFSPQLFPRTTPNCPRAPGQSLKLRSLVKIRDAACAPKSGKNWDEGFCRALKTSQAMEGRRLQIWLCRARPLWSSNHALINLAITALPPSARNLWVSSARPQLGPIARLGNYDRIGHREIKRNGRQGEGGEGAGRERGSEGGGF